MPNTSKSCTTEQQLAEKEIANNFIQKYTLIPQKPIFPETFSAKLDGSYQNSAGEWIFVEIYTHQGALKSAQRQKVCTDILKLITAEKILNQPVRKYILFGSDEAMKCFQNNSWHRKAVDKWDIKLEIGELSEQTKQNLKVAQARQKMVNAAD